MRDKLKRVSGLLIHVKEGWLILGVAVLSFVLLEAMLSLAYGVRDRIRAADPSVQRDWRAQADAYSDVSWVHRYYNEFEESSVSRWASYVYWRRRPYQGEYINVDPNGLRCTWGADDDRGGERDPLTIFVFGGSAMWGVGARDDYTIASLLASKLQERGIASAVINFGESGYVSTQEVIALIRQLQQDHVPDLAIFYDGVNDVYSAYQQQVAGLPQNEFNRVREFNLTQPKSYRSLRAAFVRRAIERLAVVRFSRSLLHRLRGRDRPDAAVAYWNAARNSIAGKDELLQKVLRVYQRNVRMAEALGQAYGFKTLFYWQPTIFNKKHLTAYEEKQRQGVESLEPFCQAAYDLARQARPAVGNDRSFHDLSGAFAEVDRPVFIDWCHLSEWGNAVIAERMATDVAKLLGDRSGGLRDLNP
jgi:lysophospholipase L1-like esterase